MTRGTAHAPVPLPGGVLGDADAILLAAPFGFGPLSKALSLAAMLESNGLRATILGDAGGAAIAQASGYGAGIYAYREPLDLTGCGARVIVSCLDVSTPVRSVGSRLVIVDSLHWMRGNWEREYEGSAELYIAQRFADGTSLGSSEAGQAVMVDAILGREFVSHVSADGPRSAAVIYPGGLGSPYLSDDYRRLYVDWVVTGFLEAARTANFDLAGSAVVLPHVGVSTPVMRSFVQRGGTIVSDFARLPDLLRSSGHALIAPGIEISVESAAVGHYPLLLPAFNGSHVAQVPTLVRLGFGTVAVPTHVREIASCCQPQQNLRATTKLVQAFNVRHLSESCFREEFHNSLVAELNAEPRQLRPRYPLGWNGAHQAVSLIRGLLA